MNITRFLAQLARTFADRTAVYRGMGRHFSYAELGDRAARAAAGLALLGMAAGDRVVAVIGHGKDAPPASAELDRLCRSHVSGYKCPEE